MMAAGMLVVAHCSAGPKLDIIKDENFLAIEENDYIEKLEKIAKMEPK